MNPALAAIFAAIFATTSYAGESDYCAHNVKFGDRSIVCSKTKFDEQAVLYQIQNAQRLYRKTVGAAPKVDGVIVFIVSDEIINNERLIKLAGTTDRVVGRYFPPGLIAPEAVIYVTPEIFDERNTDLAHELAHHLNYKNGIRGAEDEETARQFEKLVRGRDEAE